MCIDVSVIIPSYNRYPLNLLTLHSLENQTFDLSKMEVILIDDASTDETPLLQEYSAPYHFHYIRNQENLGRSITRNIGIKAASGKILIFLDAEVIVDSQFIYNHVQRHLSNEPLVIIPGNINLTYSWLLPNFSDNQLKNFYSLAQKTPLVKNRVSEEIGLEKCKWENFLPMIRKLNRPIQLLFKQDISSFSNIMLSSKPKKFQQDIFNMFDDSFRLPWISCTTLNHSVTKKLVESVGGFDESFKGYGLEDYEYGYRLYKSGVKFTYDPNINVYHQEHPSASILNEIEATKNLIIFQQKHPSIDVYLFSLRKIGIKDYKDLDIILAEYEAISQNYPDRFEHIKKAIQAMLKQIPLLKVEGKPITDLLKNSGVELDDNFKSRLLFERNELDSYGFENATKLFDLLFNL
ncbi:glycosyltransferase family 2 protein [Neobacillus sp. C211]|uniref:glycosyltransferase family 2 protein n=1 Tax=unclassified Neobacillus TaxID=2675272 RepID=UPI00397CC442